MRSPPPVESLLGAGRATVGQLLAARRASTPDRPFLTWEEQSWTYAEGLAEAERFSGWLLREAREEIRVASFLPNRPEAVWAWLGTLLAGDVYVPLNRAHRGPVLHDMLVRAGAEVLVTDREGLALLPRDVHARVVLVDGPDWAAVRAGEARTRPATDPAAAAELLYTSGTTGRSKAVVLRHNHLVRGAGWVAWSLGLTPDDVVHAWLPLFHIGGQLDMALSFIVAGGSIALQPTFSRSRFWEQVDRAGATCFIGFSNVLEILWSLPPRPGEHETTLRAGIMGGIPPALHRPFEERFGVHLHDVYGMTEAEPLALPHPGATAPVGAAGPANPDFEVVVLDENGVPLAPGRDGRIAFRPRVADVMAVTYEGDEEAFEASQLNGWFQTGDLGRMDEAANVFFIDRLKHAIRRRGENISSFELERIVVGHEAVAECSAIGVPSDLGEEDVKVVVALEEGAELEPEALRAWCADRMAAFMVPRYVEIVDELPRGPTGKVEKQKLRSVPQAPRG
jgi:crotonobetaine/carnitine-CoA ligase